jgi:hypothetical protein
MDVESGVKTEICKFYDEQGVKCVNLGRLTRAGSVLRMEESDPAMESLLYQTRRQERQNIVEMMQ